MSYSYMAMHVLLAYGGKYVDRGKKHICSSWRWPWCWHTWATVTVPNEEAEKVQTITIAFIIAGSRAIMLPVSATRINKFFNWLLLVIRGGYQIHSEFWRLKTLNPSFKCFVISFRIALIRCAFHIIIILIIIDGVCVWLKYSQLELITDEFFLDYIRSV